MHSFIHLGLLSVSALLVVVVSGASAEVHQRGENVPAERFGLITPGTQVATAYAGPHGLSGRLGRRLTAGEMVSYTGFFRASDIGGPVTTSGGTYDDCLAGCAADLTCVFADYFFPGQQCVHDTTYPSPIEIVPGSDYAIGYKTGVVNGGCDPSIEITNFDGSCTICGPGTVPSADDKTCLASGPSALARGRARARSMAQGCEYGAAQCIH